MLEADNPQAEYGNVFNAVANTRGISQEQRHTASTAFGVATAGRPFASVAAFLSASTAINHASGSDQVAQLARLPNTDTGPKSYPSTNLGNLVNIGFTTDGGGNIDFAGSAWRNAAGTAYGTNLPMARRSILRPAAAMRRI
ncbi:MAG TPA: hypothetical protein VGN04_02670 [Herbaspirillum sp.]